MDLAPFRRADDGRLAVDDVLVADVVAELDGRPVVVVSETAVRAACRRDGPRTVEAGALADEALLALAVEEGWWVRVRSSHDVARVVAAGIPVGRRVAGGGVRDDGFLKDVLAAGVACIEHDDEAERRNAERVAAILGGAWPDGDVAAPPAAAPDAFAGCAGLVAGVLRDGDPLGVDAPWPLAAPVDRAVAASVEPADDQARDARLVGLGRLPDEPTRIRCLGPTPRGAWIGVACPDGLTPPRIDPSHPEPERVLVRGALWRVLPPPARPGVDETS